MPPEVSTTDQISPTDARVQGNLLREYDQKFANILEQIQLTKLCSNAGLAKTVERGHYFTTLDDTELDRLKGHIESTPCLEVINHLNWMDGFVETRRSVQFWMWLSVIIKDVTELKSWSNLCLATRHALGSGSWTESTNTWRRCRKRLALKVLERVVQGNLSRRQDHNRHQIQHCLLCLVRTQNESV